MNWWAAARRVEPFGMVIVSTNRSEPSSGSTNATFSFSA